MAIGLIAIRQTIRAHRSTEMVVVTIKGAVARPGEYSFPRGTPMNELFAQCGGIKESGYLPEYFDFNAPITSDMNITVPYRNRRSAFVFEAAAERIHQ